MLSQAKEVLARITQRIGDRLAWITGLGVSPRYRTAADKVVTDRREFMAHDQRFEHADRTPADTPVPPFERTTTAPRGLAPPRVWTVREYLHRFEQRTGREPTFEDIDTITSTGCLGVVNHYLGLTKGEMLPQHNAFFDPTAHRELAVVDNLLLQDDRATATLRELRKLRDEAERNHELQQTAHTGNVLRGAEQILKRGEKLAEATHGKMPQEVRTRLLERRVELRREGNWNTLERVSQYEEKLMHIFRNAPDADAVKRMIADDEMLSQMPSLCRDLPSSPPDQWNVVTVHHKFWTGQSATSDPEGLVGTLAPNPLAFEPNPETWQVDMSMDRQLAKPGGNSNFDFTFLEPESQTWVGANNSIHQDDSPIRVLQYTTDQLLTPPLQAPSHDGSVFYMIITDQVPAAG
ncbi:hypothetical protein [Nocardia altamirensis]|uniref:hypothetical protein n=1 Tax=Nocardia altamirensis TaxID=472158 RepID=UPI0008409519|nr:hypothetical protein [Nocardia altamirensis]